jgi:hypothetical protein
LVQATVQGGEVHLKAHSLPEQVHCAPAQSARQIEPCEQPMVQGGLVQVKMHSDWLQVQTPSAHSEMQPLCPEQLMLQGGVGQSRSHSQPPAQPQNSPHSSMQQSPAPQVLQSAAPPVPWVQPPPTPTISSPMPPATPPVLVTDPPVATAVVVAVLPPLPLVAVLDEVGVPRPPSSIPQLAETTNAAAQMSRRGRASVCMGAYRWDTAFWVAGVGIRGRLSCAATLLWLAASVACRLASSAPCYALPMTVDDAAARLAALEKQVQSLRAELAGVLEQLEHHRRTDLSMRGQHRCPACGARKILHARRIVDRDSGTTQPLAVTTVGFFAPKPRGQFECYICVACGLVEWHVKDPSEIDIDDDVFRVEEIDEGHAGPYR